jgi:hypothetical protein
LRDPLPFVLLYQGVGFGAELSERRVVAVELGFEGYQGQLPLAIEEVRARGAAVGVGGVILTMGGAGGGGLLAKEEEGRRRPEVDEQAWPDGGAEEVESRGGR